MKTAAPKDKPLRAKAFGDRFREACDQSSHCPPKHQGRYTWIIQRFKEIRGEVLTAETCRKWHEGEAQARRDKINTLAQMLDADPVWLETGHRMSIDSKHNDVDAAALTVSVTVAIRPGTTVVIQNLPNDLSNSEAQRIANIVQAYVVRQ